MSDQEPDLDPRQDPGLWKFGAGSGSGSITKSFRISNPVFFLLKFKILQSKPCNAEWNATDCFNGIFFVSAVRDLVSTKEARNKPHERQYDHYRKGWTKCLLGHKIFFEWFVVRIILFRLILYTYIYIFLYVYRYIFILSISWTFRY